MPGFSPKNKWNIFVFPNKLSNVLHIEFKPMTLLNCYVREGFKKKKLEFSNRGGGGPKIKKNSNFSKNSAILLRMPWFSEKCNKKILALCTPPPHTHTQILLLPYIDPYVHGSLPMYSNCNIYHDVNQGSVLFYAPQHPPPTKNKGST